MKRPKVNIITFRATEHICQTLSRIMDERGIDKTSVIKLALYLLDSYMSKDEIKGKDLFEIISQLEQESRSEQPPFEIFSLAPRQDFPKHGY